MSEELLQRGLDKDNPTSKMGKWNYYNIGATTIKALKNANIIRNVNYGKLETKKVDALITQRTNVIAVVEFKQPKEFKSKTQKNKAIKQEIEVAKVLGSKIIIATDTIDTVWVNALTGKEILGEDGSIIKEKFEPTEKIEKLIEKINYSINEKNNQILPKELVNPTDLARSIWQDIWSASGESPTGSLYTFVELFIFKYLSDLGTLKGMYSFDNLIKSYSDNDAEEILQYYATTIRPKIKQLFPEGLTDGTTIINGSVFVNKNGEADIRYSLVFQKILKKFKNYGKLEHIDYDFKSKLFESFLKEDISKKNLGQYFTPLKVIRAIEKMAKDEIKEGITICDPACGVGKFLLEPIKSKIDDFFEIDGKSIKQKITLHGFDKGFDGEEQKTIILAKANMLIYFSELIKDYPEYTQEFGKIFNNTFVLKTQSILGTLAEPTRDKYELILTNPPYVTSGSKTLKNDIKNNQELKSYYKINAIGLEGLFMEWIIRALKPKGKAFIVVPDGIFNRKNDKNLRTFIKEQCFIDAIISLPKDTFFSTPKKTYILAITKKSNVQEKQKAPVFTYLVSEIGESRDINRFSIEQNDLEEAVILFNFFKGSKNEFENFNTDKRCKLFKISNFKSDTSWCIDRWWTEEEKVDLGIVNEEKTVSIGLFPELIKNVTEEINEVVVDIEEFNKSQREKLNSKSVSILDTNYFSIKRGKRITKKTINDNIGNVPVYSSSKDEKSVLGYISEDYLKKNNLILETKKSILFNLDGSVGYCFIRDDEKYSFIDVVASLKIIDKSILPEYIIIQLEKEIKRTGVDYDTKFYFNKLSEYNIEFKIPITQDGEFDIDRQMAVVEQYNLIKRIKDKFYSCAKYINQVDVF